MVTIEWLEIMTIACQVQSELSSEQQDHDVNR